eukprot:6751923-Lingulodinium_polyedra.AAC.1
MPSTDASDESTTDDGASAEEDEVDSDEWSDVDEYDDRWRGFDPNDIWDDMVDRSTEIQHPSANAGDWINPRL